MKLAYTPTVYVLDTLCFYRCGFLCQEAYEDQHRCHQGTANKIRTIERNRPCPILWIIILHIGTPVLLESPWKQQILDTVYSIGIMGTYIFGGKCRLASCCFQHKGGAKSFKLSNLRPHRREKVADRKAGCISYRRQLWRTELKKRKTQTSQVSATLRETWWKGCEGEQG